MSALLRPPFLFAFIAITFWGCAPDDKPLVAAQDEWLVMGTTLSATVYRPKGETAAARTDLDAAFAAIAEVDTMMSLYKDDSALSALNEAAASEPVAVPEPLAEVLNAARFYSMLTRGAFDVTVQPLVDLWGFFDVTKASVPDPAVLKAALTRVGTNHWDVDQDAGTVRLDAGTHIDLGAIAKGYAVDQAVAVLKSRGVAAALINLGGMVAVFGEPPNGESWVIGVRHPRTPSLIGEIRLREGAVATSGDYDRFFEADGKRFSHIIDPRTGWPVEGVFAVTVIAPNATAADALSTAAFVLGPEEGLTLLDACAGVEGMLIASSGSYLPNESDDTLDLAATDGLAKEDAPLTFRSYTDSDTTFSVRHIETDRTLISIPCLHDTDLS